MGLQRFERGLERLVEGTFAKVFRSGLQPVELGRRLAREMDLRRTVGVNGVVAPNHFEIAVNQSDMDRFSSFIDALNRELVEAVREHARKERYAFLGTVSVEIRVEPNLSSGMFLVNGQFQEQPGGGPVGVLITMDGRNVTLGDDPVVIGRLPECDIAVTDPNVSRKHAEIRRHGNDYVVVDLGSTNGTKVNGSWVSGERRLRDGDEISVGASVIRFEGS
jgi:hypothetical protein